MSILLCNHLVCFFFNKLETIQNILSSIVIMLVFSGVQFIGCLVLPLHQVYLTCLGMVKIGSPQTQFACFIRSINPVLGNLAHKK